MRYLNNYIRLFSPFLSYLFPFFRFVGFSLISPPPSVVKSPLHLYFLIEPSMSIVANLQAHQLVLSRELQEINNDIVALQQMGSRYELQCGISFHPAIDHLVVLRAAKERSLGQVNAQLAMVQESVASSSSLVSQLNAAANREASAAYDEPVPAVRHRVPTTTGVHVTTANIVSSSLYGPEVVHIQGPGGLLVSTNSSILANSPQRDRY